MTRPRSFTEGTGTLRGGIVINALGTPLRIATWAVLVMLTPAVAAHAQSCAQMADFQWDGGDVEITSASEVAGGTGRGGVVLPPHCLVEGVIDERTGAGGATYGIRFALALPDDWNGRFLFQGGGGLNGSVQRPTGTNAAGDRAALTRGFAVVSTDTGHQGSGFDATFRQDQQASLDFLYVAIGRVAELSRHAVADYYTRPAEYSYYVGCSTGGREAMLMSQRYPAYFDGIVAGAPAIRTGHSNMSLAYINATFNEFAPRDADGVPVMSGLFSDGDKDLVVDAMLNTCDLSDGLEDGMIFDTRGCGFGPDQLACSGEKTDMCLAANQVAALNKAFRGPVDSLGNQTYPRFPWDPGLNASGGGLPGILQAGGNSPVQAQSTSPEFDVDRAAARLVADVEGRMGDSTWTNLNTFRDRGGKLIFYHGMADPWFSALDTVDYYERMSDANGGMDAVRDWSRAFVVPGMGHCSGGAVTVDRFDMLTAIVDWVENGTPPDTVVAAGSAGTRPLCPYPEYPHYTGGDADDPESYQCRD